MIKLYISCLVLIIGSADMKFHQEVMEIVSYDTNQGFITKNNAEVYSTTWCLIVALGQDLLRRKIYIDNLLTFQYL